MTDCCEPRVAKFSGIKPWKVHTRGCLANMQGLPYYGPLPKSPDPRHLSFEEKERLAAKQRHPARKRRPRAFCTGYRHTCSQGGCETCLF